MSHKWWSNTIVLVPYLNKQVHSSESLEPASGTITSS